MAGQGDSPLSNAWLSRKRYQRSQTAALIKKKSADAGAAIWDDYFFPAAAAASYTITVTGASVTLAGQSATLKSARQLAITGQSVTLTGQSVNLRRAYPLTIAGQSVSLSPQSVSLRTARQLAITGASVSLSGQSVTLNVSRSLSVTGGSVAIDGQSVTLTYTPATAPEVQASRGASYFVSEKSRRKREKEKLDERELLDRAVREAYLEATGQQIEAEPTPEPPKLTTATREKIAKAIKTEYRDEITASISEIRARIKALEKELAQAAKDEDEFEMFMLMAA